MVSYSQRCTSSGTQHSRVFLSCLPLAEMKFSLYFLGQNVNPADVPDNPKDRIEWTFLQPGTLELTHNWGTGERVSLVLCLLLYRSKRSQLSIATIMSCITQHQPRASGNAFA